MGVKVWPDELYSFIAVVPAARASAFVRNPPFEMDFRFPFTGAVSKLYCHVDPRFLVLKEDKDEPEDRNDHTINANQYAWIPYRSMIGFEDDKQK